MKDLLILGLVGYVIYDRYIREEKFDLLKSDMEKMRLKVNEIKTNIDG